MPLQDASGTSPESGGRLCHRFEDVEFDELQGVLRVAGKPVVIERRPLRVLAELLLRVNEVVTKEELFDSVWDGRPTVDHVLSNAISKLRSALGEKGAARVVTVPRVGYRLLGPVQRVETLAAVAGQLEGGQPVPGRDGYVLERLLGQGSRSDVWLARHAKLGHAHVFKFAEDGARLSALKREYTLYRVMKQELGPRDDIAVVIDTNFMTAPYFLECAYGGLSLLEWAQQDGRLAAMPALDRLELFLQMARAVAAAHSVGVLHKDLKPGNILIDGEPGHWQARLTDFGSGRLLDAGRLAGLQLTALGLTHTQDVAPDALSGTYMYLAPEVMAGQAPTVQSDVYALGLLLYQLLVADLKRPMATGWQREVGDALLCEDIEAATEGQPQVRLPSVADLVARVARLPARRAERQAQELAVEQAASEQAASARRRARRPWLIAAFGALAFGLATSLWFFRQATESLAQSRQEAARAAAIGDFLHRDVLQASDVVTMGSVAKPQSLLEVLRRASGTVAQRFAGRPRTEATLRRRLAETYMKVASLTDAIREVDQAIALLAPVVAIDDAELLTLQFMQVRLDFWTGKHAKAMKELKDAERIAGPGRLEETSEMSFAAARARYEKAVSEVQFEQAVPYVLKLVKFADALPGMTVAERADARQCLLDTQFSVGNQKAADALLAELAAPPFNIQHVANEFYGRVGMGRGAKFRLAGRFADAETELLSARASIVGAGADRNEFLLAWADRELGHYFYAVGSFQQALDSMNEARDLFVKVSGPDHQYVHAQSIDIAHVNLAMGRPDAAMHIWGRYALWRKQGLAKLPYGSYVNFGLAQSLLDLHQPAQALAVIDKVNASDLQANSDWPDSAQRLAFQKGRAQVALGQKQQGRAAMAGAIAAMEQSKSWPWLTARYRRQLQGEAPAGAD